MGRRDETSIMGFSSVDFTSIGLKVLIHVYESFFLNDHRHCHTLS